MQNGTDLGSERPTATTVSTIAINAGNKSTIVVAFLKVPQFLSLYCYDELLVVWKVLEKDWKVLLITGYLSASHTRSMCAIYISRFLRFPGLLTLLIGLTSKDAFTNVSSSQTLYKCNW